MDGRKRRATRSAHEDPPARRKKTDEHDWERGRKVISERSPRIVRYPHFLSSDEADSLLSIARKTEPNTLLFEGAIVAVNLPEGEPLVAAIEYRCARATGIDEHPDERALSVRHTLPSSASTCEEQSMVPQLHLDINSQGTNGARAATVLIYLHDLPEGCGGETCFPLVGSAAHSALRDAAERLTRSGATVLHDATDREFPAPPLRTAPHIELATAAMHSSCPAALGRPRARRVH